MSLFSEEPLEYSKVGDEGLIVDKPFVYDMRGFPRGGEGPGQGVRVPGGFITSLASTRFRPNPGINKATVLHDFLYSMRGRRPHSVWLGGGKWAFDQMTKVQVDDVYRAALDDLGFGPVTRNIYYAVVRLQAKFPGEPMITKLGPKEIFVFGSNMAGRHGKGAALQARYDFGAVYGVAEGLTGHCYAFPTLNADFTKRTYEQLVESRDKFYQTAGGLPEWRFMMTRVGTGLAGFPDGWMRRLFTAGVAVPENVVLPEDWKK